jgi:hypothetical protein
MSSEADGSMIPPLMGNGGDGWPCRVALLGELDRDDIRGESWSSLLFK